MEAKVPALIAGFGKITQNREHKNSFAWEIAGEHLGVPDPRAFCPGPTFGTVRYADSENQLVAEAVYGDRARRSHECASRGSRGNGSAHSPESDREVARSTGGAGSSARAKGNVPLIESLLVNQETDYYRELSG
jgi:hypothetical protein